MQRKEKSNYAHFEMIEDECTSLSLMSLVRKMRTCKQVDEKTMIIFCYSLKFGWYSYILWPPKYILNTLNFRVHRIFLEFSFFIRTTEADEN